MPKTFVTGGTGFVGGNIVRKLVERGEEVKCLARTHSYRKLLESLDVEIVEGNMKDPESLKKAMEGCDKLYHVAGYVSIGGSFTDAHVQVNIDGMRHVLDAAIANGITKAVVTSSGSTIGHGTFDKPADEDTPVPNLTLKDKPYVYTKRQGELVALEYAKEGKLEVVVTNPTFMIGAWDHKPTSGLLILSLAKWPVAAIPQMVKNFLDVDDAADGHLLAMDKGRSGERYILGGDNASMTWFAAQALEVLGQSKSIVQIPKPLYRLAGLAGDLAEQVMKKNLPLNTGLVNTSEDYHVVSSEKAMKELGYAPGSSVEGVKKAVKWYREHGYL